jgi:hypothetical protein
VLSGEDRVCLFAHYQLAATSKIEQTARFDPLLVLLACSNNCHLRLSAVKTLRNEEIPEEDLSESLRGGEMAGT